MLIAVIGSGVAGLVAAKTLMQFGHDVVVLEQAERLGGVWRMGYPGLRLQNVAEHYRLSDFPWPFPPDEHPTALQVMRYFEAVVAKFRIDIRLGHRVTSLTELPAGWRCEIATHEGKRHEQYDRIVIATGQFTGDKADLGVPGSESFSGKLITERDLTDISDFDNKRVAVIGFGKTALDMVTLAAESRAVEVHHIFRKPRWLIPRRILGRHIADTMLARFSGAMTPSWVHPTAPEAFIQRRLKPLVRLYWKGSQLLFRRRFGLHQRYPEVQARLAMRAVEPEQDLVEDIALGALAPDRYYPLLRQGRIVPHRGAINRLAQSGIELSTGEAVAADIAVVAIGPKQPTFPFLPEPYRSLIEPQPNGAQLYRHILHPRIPRMAFAGFNVSFLFIQCVEISMLWYGAALAGDFVLPSEAEMEASSARVLEWKCQNSPFRHNRAYAVGQHAQKYIDVLLMELGVRHRRKPNFLAERFASYYSRDYANLFGEYQAARAKRKLPVALLAFDT